MLKFIKGFKIFSYYILLHIFKGTQYNTGEGMIASNILLSIEDLSIMRKTD